MKLKTFSMTVFLLGVMASSFLFGINQVSASSGDNVSGYAWSYNIGWISFNCTNNDSCFEADTGEVGAGGDLGYINEGTQSSSKEVETSSFAFFKSLKNSLGEMFDFLRPTNVYADDIIIAGTGSDYGVNVDATTGVMSGWAWNDNIGWISFNEFTGCPNGSCTPMMDTDDGDLHGWAKAYGGVAGTEWSGWISLDCANNGDDAVLFPCSPFWGGANYNATVDLTTGIFSNYAWGDDVVGWIKFSGPEYAVVVDLDQPTIDLVGSAGTTFCPGDPATLSWTTTNMTSCTATATNADPAFNGTVLTNSASPVNISPSAPTTTYALSCLGNDGVTYTDSVTISSASCTDSLILSATPNPVTIATGYTTALTWYSPSSTTFSSCTGKAYNATAGVPEGVLAVPPTGFEVIHVGLNAGTLYTATDTSVLVPHNPTRYEIDCVDMTGAHTIATTLVGRAVLYPTCDFVDTGTFLSGSPIKATLQWTSGSTLNAVAASLPSVGATWLGSQPLIGSKTNVNFISDSTTYLLNVYAGAETNQCKAALDEPILCTPGVDPECTCDPEVPGGSCYVDPICDDPNGCRIDLRGSVNLTASPDTFADVGVGESVSTVISWDTDYVTGPGTVLSFPASSFGPVADCSINGSDTVSIEHSTTFILECEDEFTGETRTDAVTVYVDGPPDCDMDPETLDIPDCIASDGFTRPTYIER